MDFCHYPLHYLTQSHNVKCSSSILNPSFLHHLKDEERRLKKSIQNTITHNTYKKVIFDILISPYMGQKHLIFFGSGSVLKTSLCLSEITSSGSL